MIQSVWPYLAVMLLAAGIFPALERRTGWKFFSVFPPIVLVYLSITALAVAGLWQVTSEIRETQSVLIGQGVPVLIFLLMVNCDLRAIFALGPRVLAVFFCTTVSLFVAFLATYLMFRNVLPAPDGWQPLAAVSGSWVGGTANLVAVKQAIGMDDNQLALALLTDAIGYSFWVALLFSVAKLAPAFNRWTRARSSAELVVAEVRATGPVTGDAVLLWLAMALLATVGSRWLAGFLPASGMISATTWTILLATLAGLVVAHTPLARFPGADRISSALLIFVVAVMASQSNFSGIGTAPLYLLCGFTILAIHAGVMLLAAKLFRFDMYLCGISSLAHIGGVAAAPILAATYSAALVPVAVLLALLGYILGTGFGLLMATVFSSLAPAF
ncbi:MAG: DUF819 domain-containing protein [Lysobacteraceae bacterium]|nr:MAG: DUF819 domain-containing protein [Xanthomonadaceae bacterium]